ncbi:alpha/beta hydrolase [Phycisphaerales bacterium AB-hyl4]|uniref:Alpha/beta hydrolase n=1 Tax=Natronomicrosphaera hydrolytica TaxID=3242702 RepID=A0ABV4U267_9BACT
MTETDNPPSPGKAQHQAPAKAPWLARKLGRAALRFSGYPGRGIIGAVRRKQAKERGGRAFKVKTDDGVELDAWFSPADPRAKHADADGPPRLPIFMLHGWVEVKEFHFPRAWCLNHQGHDVILFDHRAHGRSSGEFATFGVRERHDLRQVIDTAIEQKLIADHRVITLGFSMGASTVLQHAPTDERVAGVIAFAPFVNFREAIRSFRFKLAPWIDDKWLMRGFEAAATHDAGFDLDEATTLDAVKQIAVPVLMIEGTLDSNLPPRWHTQKLAAEKKQGPLEVITIDEATHVSLCRRTWPGLNEKIAAFCARLR